MDTFAGDLIQISESEWIHTMYGSDVCLCGVILRHDFTGDHPSVSWHRGAEGSTQADQTSPLFLLQLCGGTVRGNVCLWPTAAAHILYLLPALKRLSHPVGNCRVVPVQRAGWSLPVTFEHCLRESNHCLRLLTTCFTAGDEPMECFPGKKKPPCSFFRECFHSLWS